MRRFSQRNSLVTLSDINITPLLDLAFVLLIIFILITPSIQSTEEHGMNLKLPQGGGQYERVNSKNVHVVEVDTSGTYMLDRQVLPLAQIETRLVAERKRNPQLVVKVRVDENGRNKHFTAVLDILSRHGISIGVDTQPSGSR